MPKLRLLILVLILPFFLFAQDNQQIFKEANEAYVAKDYQIAIEKYEQILESGNKSTALFYNLGNAYYKLNRLGKAIINYERGLLLDQNNTDLKYNIGIARKNLLDEIEILPPFFLNQWWSNTRQLASSTSWAIIALLIFCLGIVGFIIWLLSGIRKQKKLGFIAGFLLLLLSLIPFALSISSASLEEDSKRAIIISKEANLRSGPDEVSTSILLLHEGTSVDLLDQIGDWYKVRLMNGEQGWLIFTSLEKI